MKEKRTASKISLWVLVILFLLGIAGIALYPFRNRNLQLKITTAEGSYIEKVGSDAIANGTCNHIEITGKEETEIIRVRIYGTMKSVLLKEMNYGEFASYIESVDNGTVSVVPGCTKITGDRNVKMNMNTDYVEMLQKMSSTFLQERLILMELWAVIVAFAAIATSAVIEKRTENNWDNHGPIFEVKKFFSDIKKYGQYMVYAAKTDLKAEVANSYLNRLWWLLEPFFSMLVYVIVFGNLMGNSIENYPTFVFSALLMWNFFAKTVNHSVKQIRSSRDIITKVYIPKFVLLLSNMILNLFKLLFSMIVLVGMMLIFRVHVGIYIFWIIPAYAVMILLAFGLGMIFMHFGVYVDDLSYAVSILLNMLMFLSGVFYNMMTTLHEPLNGLMMCLNPIAMIIDTMRNALLYNTAANVPLIGVWFLISLVLCCVGVHIVYKNENGYVKIV